MILMQTFGPELREVCYRLEAGLIKKNQLIYQDFFFSLAVAPQNHAACWS